VSAEFPKRQVLRRKAKILSAIYDWFGCLAGQPRTFGALGIAEAVLFPWKEHFKENPLYEQVITLLLSRDSEQQGWFPTANYKLPVAEGLSKLPIPNQLILQSYIRKVALFYLQTGQLVKV